MVWFTRNRRHKAPAYEIAETLVRMLVDDEIDFLHPQKFDVPKAIWPDFRAKARLYREATVLMLLLSYAEKEVKYGEVLRAYERIIFPSGPTPNGMAKLEPMRTAMQDISVLVDAQGKQRPFSWGIAWLNDIGHAEHNPVRLFTFASSWMQFYILVGKVLTDVRSVF